MKTARELIKILKKESGRKKQISKFLKDNEGIYFTASEVVERTKIKCAGSLLRDICDEAETPTKKGYVYIKIPLRAHDTYCEKELYYGYKNEPNRIKKMNLDDRFGFGLYLCATPLFFFAIATNTALNPENLGESIVIWTITSLFIVSIFVTGIGFGGIFEKYKS